MTIALFPGSFDPITNGHMDIASRAAAIFEKVIIGVYTNPDKKLMFSADERVSLAKEAFSSLPNVEVSEFSSLTVQFAREVGAKAIIRGLRVSGDFEWEFDMTMMNKRLDKFLEQVYFMANSNYQFLSSSLLKEVARLGGDISDMVPPHVARALKGKVDGEM